MASGIRSSRFTVEEAIALIYDSKGMSSGEEYELDRQLGIYSDELR